MLANIPATQTVIEITGPGGPEMLAPATRPVPEPKAGGIDPDRRRRGQPRRLPAAHGTLPDALRRSGYPRPRMLGHRGQARRRGNRVAGRRPGLRADGRRRLWRIRRGAVGAVPTDPGGCQPSRRRGPARNLLHGVDQRVRKDAFASGRGIPGCRAGRAASASPRSSWGKRLASRCWPRRAPTRSARHAAISQLPQRV